MLIDVMDRNVTLDEGTLEWIERRVHFALGRFVARIHRVAIMFEGINGPRGGSDQRCRVHITLIPEGKVVIDDVDSTIETVTARAVDRAARAVVRELERQREYRGETERVSSLSRLLET